MKHNIYKLLIAVAGLSFAGCETMPKMVYTPEVRKMSFTDSTLFKDSLNGLIIYDQMHYPNAKVRAVEKIEVIVPYDNSRIGLERWIVTHDGQDPATYIVKMFPDGKGGTNFNIGKDDGKALQDVPILLPPAN